MRVRASRRESARAHAHSSERDAREVKWKRNVSMCGRECEGRADTRWRSEANVKWRREVLQSPPSSPGYTKKNKAKYNRLPHNRLPHNNIPATT